MTSTFTTTNTANVNTVLMGLRRDHAPHASGQSFPIGSDRNGGEGRVGEGHTFVAIMTTMKLPN
jgi:hypothetical protein